tara:strand:+ start:42091 stop:44205 length:2115 start_codon:yes stop_codon:yes gene_type:complete
MLQVASISHSIGAVIFASTATLLIFHSSTRKQFPLLIFSTAVTSAWCLLAALYTNDYISDYGLVAITETLQDVSWCLCVMKLIKIMLQSEQKRWFESFYFKVFLFSLTSLLIINSTFIAVDWHPGISSIFSKFAFVGNIILSVIVLALLEHLYLSTPPDRRWGIKFICIGLGILFSYDFYLFANALMLNGVDPIMWEVRGGVSAIIAPLIAIGALRNRKWQTTFMPSRRLIFSSTAFISCGVYLLIMASVGYGIREFGGNWGKALQVLFLTGSVVVLALLLASGSARAFLQQFLVKNFFKLRYDYRKEWLNISKILSEADSQTLQSLTIRTVANLVESPKGWLFEYSDGIFTMVESWNVRMPDEITYLNNKDFINSILQKEAPTLLADEWRGALKNIQFIDDVWLIVPFKYMDSCSHIVMLGLPRTQLMINWEVQDILMMAGRQLATHLIQNKSSKELAIAKQFEAYNQFSTFIIHDLKNIDTQLKLMVINKEKHGDNPKFIKSAYQTIDNLSDKFSKLINQVKTPGTAQIEKLSLSKILNKIIQLRAHQEPKPVLLWQADCSEIEIEGIAEEFINIMCHLVENAQQATERSGSITISVAVRDKAVCIKIIDNGQGMSKDFIHKKLFKPFISTKGKKGMGIGVYQAKSYVQNHNGTIQVQSELGSGTEFCLELPILHIVTHNHINYCESDGVTISEEVGELTDS